MRKRKSVCRANLGRRQRGAALVIALVTLLVITATMAAVVQSLLVDLRQTRQAANELQAHWLADSAVGRATAQLRANPKYEGETWKPTLDASEESLGAAEIRIQRGSEAGGGSGGDLKVIVDARYPDHPWRRVVARRTFSIPAVKNQSAADQNPQETAP